MSCSPKLLLLPVAIAIGAILVTLSGCGDKEKREEKPTANAAVNPWHPNPDASYVGAQSCVECHQAEFEDWKKSDHHRAMEVATEATVLGDFSDVEFEHFGRTFRFYRKGGEFWVNAEDEQGQRQDWKIDYTFGYEPLQQYLIAFPCGRYQ